MKTLSLRLTEEMHERLRQEAFNKRLSISELIRVCVNNYYSTIQPRPPLLDNIETEPVEAMINKEKFYTPGEFSVGMRMGQLPPIQIDATSRDIESLPQPQMKPEQ
jgi:hypothetical protein